MLDNGIIERQFKPSSRQSPVEGLCYYGQSEITDQPLIKNVYTWTGTSYTNTGELDVYVQGDVHEGDYLTTGYCKGALMAVDVKEVAVAQALETSVMETSANSVVQFVRKVHVKFL